MVDDSQHCHAVICPRPQSSTGGAGFHPKNAMRPISPFLFLLRLRSTALHRWQKNFWVTSQGRCICKKKTQNSNIWCVCVRMRSCFAYVAHASVPVFTRVCPNATPFDLSECVLIILRCCMHYSRLFSASSAPRSLPASSWKGSLKSLKSPPKYGSLAGAVRLT